LVGLALWWNVRHLHQSVQHLARVAAGASFEKDLLYRQWVAQHGGVYVPVTAKTPPNPYLTNVTERDITTPSGRSLTLLNPAYVTRQVHELDQETYRRSGHVTSLKPIRPANAPDAWERQALFAFERGVPEISSIENFQGQPQLRLMRPLITDVSCLPCHAAQGYKVGDIRGGISVAVPMNEYQATAEPYQRAELLAHGAIWGLGLVSFGLGAWQILRRRRERDLAQAALRESEARYRLIFTANPVPIWVYDRSTLQFLEVNEAAVKNYGYTVEEFRTMTIRDIRPPEDVPLLEALVPRIPRGLVHTGEWRHRKKDGTVLQVAIYSHDLELPGRSARLVLAVDITERKRAQAALQQSEERFRTLVEHAPEAIVVHAAGRFVYVNRSALILAGAESPGQLLGQPVLDRFAEQCRATVQERLRIAYEERRALPLAEMQILRLDGAVREVEATTVPMVYENQPGVLAFLRDITERKRLEEKLRDGHKMEAVGQLAGGVAHDFNNMLAAMMMSLDLLQDNANLDPDLRGALQELSAGAQRAATLTRQLLMFSRRSMLEIKLLDVNNVVADLLRMLKRLIGEQIELQFHPKTDLPAVEADAGMLEQVIMNLCVNARDALPNGGRITITTEDLEVDEQRVRANPDAHPGRFVCVTVADTGCGMNEATRKRIFEPFFTTKEVGKGTGLGLATVYGIVAQHKGWMEVESQAGQGATFKVFLPASSKPAVRVNPGGQRRMVAKGHETLLLVEDEPRVRQVLARTLKVLGYGVLEAGNGHEAMKLWQTRGDQVDLLLTDMMMPEGITGLELAEKLRATKPNLKVIISSGYSPEMVQLGKATKQGIAYLTKPYEVSVLSATVRGCLDGN
jgi:PAS domain S-box-containing protein